MKLASPNLAVIGLLSLSAQLLVSANPEPRDYRIISNVNDKRLWVWKDRSSNNDNPTITFYGEKNIDQSVSKVTSMTHEVNRNVNSFELNSDNRLRLARNSDDKFSLQLNWASEGSVVFTAELGNKAVTYSSVLDLDALFPDSKNKNKNKNNNNNRRELLAAMGKMQLDDRRHVDLQKRAHVRSRQLVQTSRNVAIKLTTCDQPYNDATVQMYYTLRDDEEDSNPVEGSVTGRSTGNGRYQFSIPVRNRRDNANLVKQACRKSFETAKPACRTMLDSLHIRTSNDRRIVCQGIADQVNLLRTNEGSDIIDACTNTLKAAYDSCATTTGPVINTICDQPFQDREFTATRWNLDPKIMFPFKFQDKTMGRQTGDIPAPRTRSAFENQELLDGPNIVSLSVRPEAPGIGENYIFTAQVQCVDKDSTVKLTVEGSDNFMVSKKCAVPNNRQRSSTACELRIPGAQKQDVRDRCRVNIDPEGKTASLAVIF